MISFYSTKIPIYDQNSTKKDLQVAAKVDILGTTICIMLSVNVGTLSSLVGSMRSHTSGGTEN